MRALGRRDAVGVALLAATAAWTVGVSVGTAGARPLPTVAGLAGVGVAVAAGRRTALGGGSAGAIVGVTVVGVLAASSGGWSALSTGYGNADGTLFGLVALGGALAVARGATAAGTGALLAGLALCAASRSVGALLATLAALAVCTLGAARPRAAAAVAGVVVAVGVGAIAALGAGAGPAEPGRDSLGTRIALWREAVDLATDEPLTGIGPGRYQDVQQVSDDDDLRRAHSLPLQAAAETGLPGVVLLVALAGWALAAGAAGSRPAGSVALGVVVLLGLEGSFDWVVAEPAVSLGAGLLVGAATARQDRGSRG